MLLCITIYNTHYLKDTFLGRNLLVNLYINNFSNDLFFLVTLEFQIFLHYLFPVSSSIIFIDATA